MIRLLKLLILSLLATLLLYFNGTGRDSHEFECLVYFSPTELDEHLVDGGLELMVTCTLEGVDISIMATYMMAVIYIAAVVSSLVTWYIEVTHTYRYRSQFYHMNRLVFRDKMRNLINVRQETALNNKSFGIGYFISNIRNMIFEYRDLDMLFYLADRDILEKESLNNLPKVFTICHSAWTVSQAEYREKNKKSHNIASGTRATSGLIANINNNF